MAEGLAHIALPLFAALIAHPLLGEHLWSALIRPAADEFRADAELLEGSFEMDRFERKSEEPKMPGRIDEARLRLAARIIFTEVRGAQMADDALTGLLEARDGLTYLLRARDA